MSATAGTVIRHLKPLSLNPNVGALSDEGFGGSFLNFRIIYPKPYSNYEGHYSRLYTIVIQHMKLEALRFTVIGKFWELRSSSEVRFRDPLE